MFRKCGYKVVVSVVLCVVYCKTDTYNIFTDFTDFKIYRSSMTDCLFDKQGSYQKSI